MGLFTWFPRYVPIFLPRKKSVLAKICSNFSICLRLWDIEWPSQNNSSTVPTSLLYFSPANFDDKCTDKMHSGMQQGLPGRCPASYPGGRYGSTTQVTRDCYLPHSPLLFLILQEFTHSSLRLTACLPGDCHHNLVGLSSSPPWQRSVRLRASTSC